MSVLVLPELDDVNDADGAVDTQRLRKVFGRFPTGITAICVVADGQPVGFAASSFNTISADPPLVSLAVQTGSATWPGIRSSERIGVSIFAADQSLLCRQMASKTGDRFAGAAWSEGEGGSLLLAGAAAWMECSIEFEQTVGDHEVVILRVHRSAVDGDMQPLVFGDSKFHELNELVPPKPGDEPGARAVQQSLLSLSLGWW